MLRSAVAVLTLLLAPSVSETITPTDPRVCVFLGDYEHLKESTVRFQGHCGPGPHQSMSLGADSHGVTYCTREKCVHVVILVDSPLLGELPEITGPLLP